MAIHHIDVDDSGAGVFDGAERFAKSSKISRQQRGSKQSHKVRSHGEGPS
jgi:hypothetical protein